jgi:hypothetical protein
MANTLRYNTFGSPFAAKNHCCGFKSEGARCRRRSVLPCTACTALAQGRATGHLRGSPNIAKRSRNHPGRGPASPPLPNADRDLGARR